MIVLTDNSEMYSGVSGGILCKIDPAAILSLVLLLHMIDVQRRWLRPRFEVGPLVKVLFFCPVRGLFRLLPSHVVTET